MKTSIVPAQALTVPATMLIAPEKISIVPEKTPIVPLGIPIVPHLNSTVPTSHHKEMLSCPDLLQLFWHNYTVYLYLLT